MTELLDATQPTSEPPVDDSPRRGGVAVWEPSVMPPIGRDLTEVQSLACAFRHVADIGFAENLAGHIAWQLDGKTDMLVNPWGLWWSEFTASDLCVLDEMAHLVSGRWDVTPAIHLHTELHRTRSDVRVIIRNHPYHVTVLAALGVLPELLHQTGSLFLDEICFVDEYVGEIDSPRLAADLAEQIGDCYTALVGSHGVIVTGATLVDAVYRAASIDRVCRLAYDVMLIGRDPLKMSRVAMTGIQQSLKERAAARASIARDPRVLD